MHPTTTVVAASPSRACLSKSAKRFGVDLHGVPGVGDSARDLIAGAAVGCEPHLVLTGKAAALRGRPLPDNYPPGTRVHDDLMAFADYLVTRT